MARDIKKIQEQLDDATRTRCAKEWKATIKQVEAILCPFFKPYGDASNDMREIMLDMFKDGISLTSSGGQGILLMREKNYNGSYLGVPMRYVQAEQEKASAEFIASVERLKEDVDNLYGEVESLNGR